MIKISLTILVLPNRYLQFEIVATMSESEAKDTYSAQAAITELDLKNEVGQ